MQGPVDHITVRGFRSLADVKTLALDSVNVLIGANGSGKSNLIQAFSLLKEIEQGRLSEYTQQSGGADSILHFGAKKTSQIDLEISFADGRNGYRVTLMPAGSDELLPTREETWFWDKEKHEDPYTDSLPPLGSEAGISGRVKGTGSHVKRWMSSFRVYHFHDTGPTSPMKRTADLADNRYFRADGSNLAAYLYFLSLKHPESYQLIVSSVRQVTPFFKQFELTPSRLNEDKIRLEWTHVSSDKYFDASAFSDGTLRYLCLATLFLQPATLRPSLILVDEPELGLIPMRSRCWARSSGAPRPRPRSSSQRSPRSFWTSSSPRTSWWPVAGRARVLLSDSAGMTSRIGWTSTASANSGRRTNWAAGQGLSRLLILVEGETEETFVDQVLAPRLYATGMHSVSARLMGNARLRSRRGGIRSWSSALHDIGRHLRQDGQVYVSTMVDYYGLPGSGGRAWPGRARANDLAHDDKAPCIEDAMAQDVKSAVPDSDPDRFIPFVTMHEFEGLLFSDCASFARGIGQMALQSQFEEIRRGFLSPEHINDSPTTNPSRRVAEVVRGYEKVLLGTIAALEIGLAKIMEECPHFRQWVNRLGALAP